MARKKSNISPSGLPHSDNGNAGKLPITINRLRNFKGFENISKKEGEQLIRELYDLCDVIFDIYNNDEHELS